MELIEVLKDSPLSITGIVIIIGYIFHRLAMQEKEKAQEKAINENTTAILKLEFQIELLNKTLSIIPQVVGDISLIKQRLDTLEKHVLK
jgi:DNA-binding Xre family transcriptional regulator